MNNKFPVPNTDPMTNVVNKPFQLANSFTRPLSALKTVSYVFCKNK